MASRRAAAAVFIAYNLLLALLWAGVGSFAAATIHLAAVFVPALLQSTALADAYPAFAVMGIWTEMGAVLPRLHPDGATLRDAAALHVDQMIFGTHWHVAWLAQMPWPWFSSLMYAAYCSYYVLLIGLPLALWLARRREALADVAFRLMLVYAGCAMCYLIFPVIGPAAFPPKFGDSLGTSLPSTHAAGSMMLALAARRWVPRLVAVALTVQAVAIAFSTVYTQNHYAIDAVAGVLLATALTMAVEQLNRRPTAVATARARRQPLSLPDAA